MHIPLLGFDIGGTKCAVVLGYTDQDARQVRIADRIAFPTEVESGPEQALQRLEAATLELLQRHQLEPTEIEAAGVSCGGPLDSRRGVILSPPNLPGWDAIPITDRLAALLGGSVPVGLQNDANAGALAEWYWGAGQGSDTMVFLTFGTGLGAGLILSGRLHAGRDDLAGEAGHLRLAETGPVGYGKAGSFEGFCSGGGIRRTAVSKIQEAWASGETVTFCLDQDALELLDVRTVADAARAGDPLAAAIFATTAFYLGRGLSLLIDLLNPEVIVIGGIYGRCEDLMATGAQLVIADEVLPAAAARCRIVPAALGEAIGDYAALAVALNQRGK